MNLKTIQRKFCVAPMMGYTTPHARKLYRLLSKKAFLFTEMIASQTMLHSKNKDIIIQNEYQNPIALQVGGSNSRDLKKCAEIAKSYNYNEINLNVGCPSKAVQKGSFGACLMQNKLLVRECLEEMNKVDINVSVKCRIGLGKNFNYNFFYEFIDEIIKSEINTIYVHARNAILSGLSPKGNRNIPPLNYEFVKKIKNEFPNIEFILNGGINSISKASDLSKEYDGVMLGRLIQTNPFCLSKVDKLFYLEPNKNIVNEKLILEYFEYIKTNTQSDSIFRLLSPILQIFFAIPNGKKFKTEIHNKIKNQDLDSLRDLFIKFINQKKEFAVN